MEKYQKMFFERMKKTLNQWELKDFVEEGHIYRFLHTVKGTAASIGLVDISKEAEKKIEQVNETESRPWGKDEWQPFLQFIFAKDTKNEEVQREEEKIEKITENEKLILLVDEDITTVNALKANLEKEGYMVLAALSANKALKLFYDQKPDCILLGIGLQGENGFELLDTLFEKSQAYLIPIILLSSEDKRETRLRGYKRGAADYLVKPFEFDELLVRVENRIKFKEMASNAVLIDELTGAFNRKFFKMELSRYLYELTRKKNALTLVVIDLDDFKKVNDQHGHVVGDIVLSGFSQCILKNKRSSDYLIRYGGEEFILLLPHTKKEEAKIFVERLLKEFSAISFLSEQGESFSVTFSAGVVEVDNPSTEIEEYVKQADTALYDAKNNGRNQVCIYDQNHGVPVAKKNAIHIAVIDDSAVVHELVKDRLSKLSFGKTDIDLQSFRDGETFFASPWHKQPGKFLILLDGIMPGMDGLEVLRKLRDEYQEDKYIVLMLTGRKSEEDIVRALELGADDYLTKPFSVAELEARVKRLVKRMM